MDSKHQNLNPSCKMYAGDYPNLSTAEIFFFVGGGASEIPVRLISSAMLQ